MIAPFHGLTVPARRTTTWVAVAAVAGGFAASAAPSPAAQAGHARAHRATADRQLREGQTLKPGQVLRSRNRRYAARMQTDGNLVLTTHNGRRVLWSTQTGGNPGASAVLQRDGNLVVYGKDRQALYASGTHGSGYRLILQDDGNFVIYDGANAPHWSSAADVYLVHPNQILRAGQSRRSPNGAYLLTMQPDGNLVVYERATHRPLWSTQTHSRDGARAVLGGDGNLVVYGADQQPVYASATQAADARLVMQDDGNLVIYGGDKVPRWASKVETSTLYGGQTLHPGQSRLSPNGRFRLDAQADGNLVLREVAGNAALWSSVTGGRGGGETTLQADGNLVVLGGDGHPSWASGTQGDLAARLVVQDDGNVVLYDGAKQPFWSTGTGGR